MKSQEFNYLSRVIEVCGSAIRGAQKTTEGIIQQLTSSLIVFAQSKIKNITAKTTIKFNNEIPQAIFIIFPDEEKSTYDFISLFITETYIISQRNKPYLTTFANF
jgi:type IV secretory pathway TraG/TraD family ATPase VirD4